MSVDFAVTFFFAIIKVDADEVLEANKLGKFLYNFLAAIKEVITGSESVAGVEAVGNFG